MTAGMIRTAVISGCEQYRYRLARIWDVEGPTLTWIMLNPSTADGQQDDPTIRRCIGFSQLWGYGGLEVLNLFALRATHPEALVCSSDPVGPENELWLDGVSGRTVIAAWGALARPFEERALALVRKMRVRDVALHHLGLTKAGHPRHPLYLRGDTTPTLWSLR